MATAILVDGAYFLHRYRRLHRQNEAADVVAKNLFTWALRHLDSPEEPRRQLYRIFFYDCPPLQKKAHHPLSGSAIDYSKTPESRFRLDLHAALRQQRKVALRLGRLSDLNDWVLKGDQLKRLLRGEITPGQLTEKDIVLEIRQKGVDMRIGLDIASLAFKKQVDQIVLVAGDADFVPAAKLARREGIDFVLDPMWGRVADDLREHIDGLRSTCPRPVGAVE